MTPQAELEHALAAITATLNEQQLDQFETDAVQALVTSSIGSNSLTVDDGGGLHDESGARIGAIRRTDSGEWITERQNPDAPRADAPIAEQRSQGPPRSLLAKLFGRH